MTRKKLFVIINSERDIDYSFCSFLLEKDPDSYAVIRDQIDLNILELLIPMNSPIIEIRRIQENYGESHQASYIVKYYEITFEEQKKEVFN